MRVINLVVIHCSDSDIKAHDNPETINEWHIARGFSSIGYSYFIDKGGNVHTGRPEEEIGAHCRGFNTRSIGICLSGRHEFTDVQFQSLEVLVKDICKRYAIEKSDIVGHCELDAKKTCPNFDVHALVSKWEWH